MVDFEMRNTDFKRPTGRYFRRTDVTVHWRKHLLFTEHTIQTRLCIEREKVTCTIRLEDVVGADKGTPLWLG